MHLHERKLGSVTKIQPTGSGGLMSRTTEVQGAYNQNHHHQHHHDDDDCDVCVSVCVCAQIKDRAGRPARPEHIALL